MKTMTASLLVAGLTASASFAQVTLPEVNPLDLSGAIVTAGSSTVYPLAERIAERFKDEGFSGNVTIDSIGTGAGFSRFSEAGETPPTPAVRSRTRKSLSPPRSAAPRSNSASAPMPSPLWSA